MITTASRVTREGDVALFRDFFAERDFHGGGLWFVKGRSPDHYGGLYVMVVESNGDYKHRRAGGQPVRKGWRTKREAQAMADRLNARDAAYAGGYERTPENAIARDLWLAGA